MTLPPTKAYQRAPEHTGRDRLAAGLDRPVTPAIVTAPGNKPTP